MLQFNPNDPEYTQYKLQHAIKESDLTLQQLYDRLNSEYDVELLPSSLSRSFTRGLIKLQRALQILAICGVSEIGIEGT